MTARTHPVGHLMSMLRIPSIVALAPIYTVTTAYFLRFLNCCTHGAFGKRCLTASGHHESTTTRVLYRFCRWTAPDVVAR
ncbi:hypothetical protein EDC04DRAFT_2657170 [Pisolithus marmoratus]|nr:hypothetical protein EDC04DRAFT_2657170 [Pisolithus marmoratus]